MVSDLVWVVKSPSLFGTGIAPPRDWTQLLVEISEPWLMQLDSDPSEAVAWLCKRLRGDYVAMLLEYWIECCPVLSSTSTHLRKQLGMKGSREVRGML